jgi:glycopeptide antibiotics resistance protein
LLAGALLLLTIYGSLIPLRYEPIPWDEAVQRFRDLQAPDLWNTEARADWVVNTIQYAVLSFCGMAALCVDRRWWVGLLAAAVLVPAGCALAVALEFTQQYFPPRTVSLNDVLIESLGVVLGALGWLVMGQWTTGRLRRFWSQRGLAGLAAQVLPVYLVVVLVLHLMPFDVVLGRQELAEKYQEGRIQLHPFADLAKGGFSPWLKLLANMAVFAPFGALLALAPRWSARGGGVILAAGLALTAAIELGQLVVYTRNCDVTDVLTGTTAILGGWWLVRALSEPEMAAGPGARAVRSAWDTLHRRLGRLGAPTWVGLALAWALVVALANWQPFDFTLDPARFQDSDADFSDESTAVAGLRRMSWAPFVDYYWGSRYQALDQFVLRSASFAPLGICLALAFGRRERSGEVVTLLAGLALAALVEFGQYFIPERHPSVTDLLIEVLGAWLGYRLAQHTARALVSTPQGHSAGRFHWAKGHGQPQWPYGPAAARRGASLSGSLSSPMRGIAGRVTTAFDRLAARPFWAWAVALGVVGLVLLLGIVLTLRIVLSILG